MDNLLNTFNCILKLLQAFGLSTIDYDKQQQQFIQNNRKWYVRLMLCYNLFVPLAYLVIRLRAEQMNYNLNKIEPGVRRFLNPPKLINEAGNALAFLIFARKFYKQQQQPDQLIHTCSQTQKAVKCIQRIAKSKFRCSMILLLAMYLVIVKIVLALGWSVYSVQLDRTWGPPDCVFTDLEYFISLALIVCSLTFHLQLLLYCCHLIMSVCIYASYNRYMESMKQSQKMVKALGKLLEQHATLQQVHYDAIRYFSLYCWFMVIKTFFEYGNYLRVFQYDEQGVFNHVDEDLEALEVVCTVTTTRDVQVWKAAMQLLWCLSTFMSLLYVAYAYQRERMYFNSNVLHLVEYPEYFAHLASPSSELPTATSTVLPAVQQQTLNYGIIDFMLHNSQAIYELGTSDIVLMKLKGLRLPLKQAAGAFKLLTLAAIFTIVLDWNNLQEMQLLNNLVKHDLL